MKPPLLYLKDRLQRDNQMIVAVGSTNPTKIEPVKKIFSHHFKNLSVRGVNVSSGVDEQPKNVDETFQGALNRARNALKKVPEASYGVGIEGGIHEYKHGWFEQTMVVIVDKIGNIGIGSSGGLVLPNKVIKSIQAGKNLEQAVDKLFGTNKIGEGIGMFGVFTNGVVTRAEGVSHGVAFALARFLHEDIYTDIELKHVKINEEDSLLPEVFDYLNKFDFPLAYFIQKKFKIGFSRAEKILRQIETKKAKIK